MNYTQTIVILIMCVLSINTCDGYTKFEDGTKIKVSQIECYCLTLKPHCSTPLINLELI